VKALNYAHPEAIFETTPENKPESKFTLEQVMNAQKGVEV
jgi:hypothetical protein